MPEDDLAGTYTLQKMDGTHYIITKDQKGQIEIAMVNGQKFVAVEESTIPTHQITGIDPTPIYLRKTNMALAVKNLRMCRKCGTVVPRMDRCPCDLKPKKYPSLLQQAFEENPKVGEELTRIRAREVLDLLPSPTPQTI